MGNVPATSGGCWYCETDEGEMPFSMEFDCWLHIGCLRKHLQEDPHDLEALIFAKEFVGEYDVGMTMEEIQRRIDAEC
jgi:hypothetical protein